IYRPAAIKQLQTLGKQLDMPVFEKGTDVSPVEISKQAIEYAKEEHHDYVLIDTAGRLHVDDDLMQELADVKAAVNPDEIFLVVDAMTGQDAVNVAENFNDQLDINGVVLTKLDGDTRGGAALSIKAVTDKPIKFIGTGEKLDEMQELADVKAAVNPDEIFLVVDAMTGQDAVNVAENFNDQLDINGVVLTKLDGDTRGGAALSIKAVTDKPIKFIGTGEKLDEMEI